jgi:hypothetical protein
VTRKPKSQGRNPKSERRLSNEAGIAARERKERKGTLATTAPTVLVGGCLALCSIQCWAQPEVLSLPHRAADAPSGKEFAQQVALLSLAEREQAVSSQVLAGNVPDFLRKFCPVQVTNVLEGRTNTGTFFVAPDYLAIGSDGDYLLMPLSPNLAQRIADTLHCSLPTPKMVDAIYAAAAAKLSPSPIPPSPAMTTVNVFSNHNAMVHAQRAEQLSVHALGALVAGHQKDVVLSAKLAAAPGKVAIYGWHRTNGVPIQPLHLGHTAAWVDYSQCIRLVLQDMVFNGQRTSVSAVLTNSELAGLLSDEGPVLPPAYPTNALPQPEVAPNASHPPAPLRTGPDELPQFPARFATNSFGERLASFRLEPGVKVHLNAPPPADFVPERKVLLIFYALPNGNTTAQTIGKAIKSGDDWHYNIQHIGAQTRFLRHVLTNRVVVLAYLENGLKSWPTWRKQHGDKLIPQIFASVRQVFAGHDVETALCGHSGGGSLIFGYLNSVEKLPDDLVRIALLDSNYAYDPALGHADKIGAWLKAGEQHCLCVLAYNDAVALLDGKSFVSAAGGTWGRSHAMEQDLAREFSFTSQTNGGFEKSSALAGRVQFLLKENPERTILHTVQVELNGFIHCMLTGTKEENRGYEYFGPRAYSKWIQSD